MQLAKRKPAVGLSIGTILVFNIIGVDKHLAPLFLSNLSLFIEAVDSLLFIG